MLFTWTCKFNCRVFGWVAKHIRGSIVVSISACHAEDPGSIPGRGAMVYLVVVVVAVFRVVVGVVVFAVFVE